MDGNRKRYQIIPITDKVIEIISRSGIIDGIVLVNPMHITASVYVNDLESDYIQILCHSLNNCTLFWTSGQSGSEYLHHRTGEDNGDAHLKRQLLGQQVTMAITNGKLHLGPWEESLCGI